MTIQDTPESQKGHVNTMGECSAKHIGMWEYLSITNNSNMQRDNMYSVNENTEITMQRDGYKYTPW